MLLFIVQLHFIYYYDDERNAQAVARQARCTALTSTEHSTYFYAAAA